MRSCPAGCRATYRTGTLDRWWSKVSTRLDVSTPPSTRPPPRARVPASEGCWALEVKTCHGRVLLRVAGFGFVFTGQPREQDQLLMQFEPHSVIRVDDRTS